MREDKLLVRQFKRGRAQAFRRIYEKYSDDLLTLAVNLLGDGRAAEDVVQDVFARFAESPEKFRPRDSLKAYLATCAMNRARDLIRKNKRQQTVAVNQAEQMASNADGPIRLVIRTEQLQRLARAMARLPYEQRETVVLRLHGDLKFRQIAKLQNVPTKTAQTRYRYALEKLRSILNGEVEK